MTTHPQKPDSTIIEILDNLEIEYELLDHRPFFSCRDSSSFWKKRIEDSSKTISNSKALLLRDKQKHNHYMLIISCDKRVDLKEMRKKLDSTRLSFASKSDLEEIIQAYPGAVSPLSLVHDQDKQVQLFIDKDVLKKDIQTYHPGNNKYSVELTTESFQKYLQKNDIQVNEIEC